MLNFKLVKCNFLNFCFVFAQKIIIEGVFVSCKKTISVKKMVIFHKLDIQELWLEEVTWNKVTVSTLWSGVILPKQAVFSVEREVPTSVSYTGSNKR